MKKQYDPLFLFVMLCLTFFAWQCLGNEDEQKTEVEVEAESEQEATETLTEEGSEDSCDNEIGSTYATLAPELDDLEKFIKYFHDYLLHVRVLFFGEVVDPCEESHQCYIKYIEENGGEYIQSRCSTNTVVATMKGETILKVALLKSVKRVEWGGYLPLQVEQLPQNVQTALINIYQEYPPLNKGTSIYPSVWETSGTSTYPDSIWLIPVTEKTYHLVFFHGWSECSDGCLYYVRWTFFIDEVGHYEVIEKECQVSPGLEDYADCRIELFDIYVYL